MVHPFVTSGRPLAFAHRGGCELAPENTLAAFDRGLALGADGLELDVHLSSDGVVVVHHDRTLDRTTNLQGPVAARTRLELTKADAGYRFRRGDDFPFRDLGLGVPALEDVLARYRDIPIIVEMKVNSPALARATVETVRRSGDVGRVCLGSFGWRVLRVARRLEPAIATSASRREVQWALYRAWLRWPVSRVTYGGYQVPEWAGQIRVLSPLFVNAAHKAGLAVHVWVVNTRDEARRFLAWGVDGLITDRPDIIMPIVQPLRSRDP